MSSIPVNNNLNVLANIMNQTQTVTDSRAVLSDKQEELIKDSFDMVMNRVSSQTAGQTNVQTPNVSAVSSKNMSVSVAASDSSNQSSLKSSSTQTTQKSEDNTAKQTDNDMSDKGVSDKNVSESNVSDKTASDNTVSDKAVSDVDESAVSEAGEELVEAVADEMGITIEEVEEIMEILGLSAVQLFDPENMKQLLITLSGNEDSLSILTDGELYGHLQNMLDMVETTLEDLQTQLGLSEEELGALIADMAQVETTSEPEIVPEELTSQSDKEPEVNLEGMKDYAVTVHKDGETIEVKVTVDDVSGEQTSKEEVTAAPETQKNSDNKSDSSDLFGNSKGENKSDDNMAGNLIMQNPIEQPDFNETVQQPVMERYVSTQDIMDQIMESMKINLKGDVQELELQLHPASLGNVHVQIAAKDGMVTAQFIAQNETVKAAIESQLIQLKEQFEEQGIKVDEVEVAVGNYKFDHSFAGNEENQQGDAAQNGKKSRRNINLSELDLEDLPEDMDDSERIAAEMMAQSGNMVDYTA
ncbi:MAG: hypothetical protein HDR03_00470 [Lachnospiraceae bacterium]|nr:hypothetical protein [Lachnospiraceae bacterium]